MLTGRSALPDPIFAAYRKDLADIALAGRVIASHYAEPLPCTIAVPTPLRSAASADSSILVELRPGDPFLLLERTSGWAWGYGGEERRVGYVLAGTLA